MLGSVEQEYLHDILHALMQRDGRALIALSDRMAERSLSFEIALQELAVLLHRIALAQSVPHAIAVDDPDRAAIEAMAASFSAEEIQLFYQIVLHGRQDIGLAPDDYAGFTMTLMRMLAFVPEAGAVRTAAPQSVTRPEVTAPDLKKKNFDGDWNAFVNSLPLAGMERMLAHNCELIAWQGGTIELRVPHDRRHLNDHAYQDRLRTALEEHLGEKVKLQISVGASRGNTISDVQGREDQQRQSEAVMAINCDPFVQDFIEKFDAQVLPSTIKPLQ